MSAVETVSQTLQCAVHGLPPGRGSLFGLEDLHGDDVRERLRHSALDLARVGAAKLRLDDPPLGDDAPLRDDVLFLAAALGGAYDHPAAAERLLAALPTPHGAWEHLVRHLLVSAFLQSAFFQNAAQDDPEAPSFKETMSVVADAARAVSPWTALFERPPLRRDRAAWTAGERLRERSDGRRLLCARLAEPADGEVILWRTRYLDRLRMQDADLVLDVYEATWIRHASAHLRRSRRAALTLTGADRANDAELDEALAVADWWGPLWAIERSYPDLVRERRGLGYELRAVLELHRLARNLRNL